jgi:hypothetical protein
MEPKIILTIKNGNQQLKLGEAKIADNSTLDFYEQMSRSKQSYTLNFLPNDTTYVKDAFAKIDHTAQVHRKNSELIVTITNPLNVQLLSEDDLRDDSRIDEYIKRLEAKLKDGA